jgi:hypothetical protein
MSSQNQKNKPAATAEVIEMARQAGQTPVCFVVDEDSSIRHFVSLIMQGSGIDTQEFSDGASFRKGIGSRALTLAGMGCDCGQGYLLGQPMPEARFVSLLRLRANLPKAG